VLAKNAHHEWPTFLTLQPPSLAVTAVTFVSSSQRMSKSMTRRLSRSLCRQEKSSVDELLT